MIGQSFIAQDTVEKVTGKALYAGDFSMENTLHLKILFAEHPHALIQSLSIDRALTAPGVIAIYTAEDIPENSYGLLLNDQPVLCSEKVLFCGDQIAAVVAESEAQAVYAASLIDVVYHHLPILTSPQEALSSTAITLHKNYPGNIAHKIHLKKGDIQKAFSEADLVFEQEYLTPMQEHAYLEPEAGMAFLDEQGRVVILTGGQSVFEDQRQISRALGLPADRVRVMYGTVGGAFGGKSDLSLQIVLALAAWKLARPVKAVWSRRESIRGHAKRHAMTIKHRWGVKKDGRVTAAEVEILIDAGAYMYTSSSVLECLHSICVGPYEVPNITLNGSAVYTNNIPGGAFRGYGAPQTAFAAEVHLSRIAEILGIDPITIRSINCLEDHSRLPTGTTLPGQSSLPELIKTCAEASGCIQGENGWKIPQLYSEGQKLGYGFSLGIKATGYGYGYPEGSFAKIILHGDSKIERVEVLCSAADLGQGARTVLAQLAAQELRLSPEIIQVVLSDTDFSEDSGATNASRITYVVGNAIRQAANKALEMWQDESRPAIGEGRWVAPLTTAPDPKTGSCEDNISYSYAALAALVNIDKETGSVEVEKVFIAQDVGKAINPLRIEGQIEGAIVQGIGWTLYEDFQINAGDILSDSFNTYLIPTAGDIPLSILTILIENADPIGPFGARGVGEIPFVPVAPAVVTGIHDACGVWLDSLPVKPARLLLDLIPK